MDPHLLAKCDDIQIHLPFIFENNREVCWDVALSYLVLLPDLCTKGCSWDFSESWIWNLPVFSPVISFLFLQSLFYIHASTFLWLCSSKLLGLSLFLSDFYLRDKPKLYMGSYFFEGSLPSFPYSGSGRKYFTFSCALTLKSTEGWYYLNMEFSVKRIQLGFQIQNSYASLTGRNLHSSIFSLCPGLVWCLIMGQHYIKSLCDHLVSLVFFSPCVWGGNFVCG